MSKNNYRQKRTSIDNKVGSIIIERKEDEVAGMCGNLQPQAATFSTLHRCYKVQADLIDCNEMDWVCSIHGRDQKCIELCNRKT